MMNVLVGKQGVVICLLLIAAIEAIVLLQPTPVGQRLAQENGPIENASVVLYLLAACWLFLLGFSRRFAHAFGSATLVLCLALRELDFHDRFTTMGIFKTRFYISDKVPVLEKCIVTMVVLLLLVALIRYVTTYYKSFLSTLLQRKASAICVALAVTFGLVAKTFDSLSAELNSFLGPLLHMDLVMLARMSEETLELGIPLFILLAIVNGLAEQQIRYR